jgi:hypothetical protein
MHSLQADWLRDGAEAFERLVPEADGGIEAETDWIASTRVAPLYNGLEAPHNFLPVYPADRAGSPQRYASSAASALGYPGTKAYVRSLACSSFGRAIHVVFVGSYCR